MVRSDLPPGVSPTNEKSELAGADPAPPTFVSAPKPNLAKGDAPSFERGQTSRFHADASDDHLAKPVISRPFNPVLLTIILGAALAAFAVALVAAKRSPQPLCAEQPHWNQYNCRAG